VTFSNFRNMGSVQPGAAGSSISFNLTSNPQAGDILCIAVAHDNTGSATPTATLDTSFLNSGSGWTLLSSLSVNSPTATSGGGVRLHVWLFKVTSNWAASSVQITLSASVTARAGTAIAVAASGTVNLVAGFSSNATGTGSQFKSAPNTSGALSGELQFAAAATEANAAVSWANTPDISATAVSATGGGSAANAAVTLAAKVYDDAGVSSMTTTTSDGSIAWTSVVEAGVTHTVDQTDNMGMTDTPVYVLTMIRADIEDLGLTDSTVIAQTHNFSRVDALGLTDSATVNLSAGPVNHTVNQTDNLGLTDAAVPAQAHTVARSENLGLTDIADVQLQSTAVIGTPTVIESGQTTTDNTVFNTASVTLDAGKLYILHTAGAAVAGAPTITGPHGTWNTIANGSVPNDTVQHSAFWIAGTGTTGAITITYSATQANFAWRVYEITGAHLTTPVPAGQVEVLAGTATSLTTTLANTPAATSIVMSHILYNAGSAQAITLPSEFNALGAIIDMTSPTSRTLAAYEPVVTDATVQWGTANLSGKHIITYEIAVGVTTGTTHTVTPSDPIGLTDAATVQVGANILTIDSIGLTDSINVSIPLAVNVSDLMTLSDGTVETTNDLSQVDNLGLTDTFALVMGHARVQTDNDNVTLVMAHGYVKSNDEELTDSAVVSLGISVPQSDNMGLTDSVVIEAGKSVQQVDTENLTDAATLVLSMSFPKSDNLGLTDVALVNKVNGVSQTDSLGLTDSIVAVGSWKHNQSDAMGLTDTANVTMSGASSLDVVDNLGLTDSISAAHTDIHPVSDNLGLTDTVVAGRTMAASRIDNMGLTDSFTVSLGHARAPIENLGLTDSFTVTLGHARVQTDNLGLTDSFTVFLGKAVTVVDSENLTDLVVVAEAHARVQLDAMGLTDSVAVSHTDSQSFSDIVGLTDNATVQLILPFAAFTGWGIPI
jgi:hypothetical protein